MLSLRGQEYTVVRVKKPTQTYGNRVNTKDHEGNAKVTKDFRKGNNRSSDMA
jgi:hypothetical protein